MSQQITLAKALSLKNKLAKEIAQSLTRLIETNSVIEGQVRSYEPQREMEKIIEKRAKLVELKTLIHTANEPIRSKIFEISELKSFCKTLRTMPTKEGVHSNSGYGGGDPQKYIAHYNGKAKDEMIEQAENSIEKIQDELNAFNYNTKIQIA